MQKELDKEEKGHESHIDESAPSKESSDEINE
jgi:hypothetical protein